MDAPIPPAPRGAKVQDVFERMDGFRNPKIDAPEPAAKRRSIILVLSCVFSAAGCALLIVSIMVFCAPSAPLSCLVADFCNSVFKGAY